jgi:sugar-specific transcriptional regulator TrmB
MTPFEAEKSLVSLGLSKQEATVYLAIYTLGEATASQVAKEQGLKRTTVYPILKKLAGQGFINTYIKKSRQIYRAEKPDRVAKIYSGKLQHFVDRIPALKTLQKSSSPDFGLRFIETRQELERFYKDTIEEYRGKEYRSIGDVRGWESIDPEFFTWYRRARSRAKIKIRLLLTDDSRSTNPTERDLLRDFRYLPSEYQFRCSIDIYKDKILIVSPDLNSLAVVIAVPAMMDIFGSMFEMIWNNTPVITR